MPRLASAHKQYGSEFVDFAHVQRHFFAWHGPYMTGIPYVIYCHKTGSLLK